MHVGLSQYNQLIKSLQSGANEIHKSEKISLKNLDNFDTIIGDLIDNSDLSITNAVFSIAGPKIGNTISMTTLMPKALEKLNKERKELIFDKASDFIKKNTN